VTTVVVTPTARRNLDELIETLSLPPSTRDRVKASLEPLRRFPLLGGTLDGRWAGFRFILGPWRWMIVVYRHDEALDRVAIVTIRDARSARSPRLGG
jgi:plasmid stabilization system protein ParE